MPQDMTYSSNIIPVLVGKKRNINEIQEEIKLWGRKLPQ